MAIEFTVYSIGNVNFLAEVMGAVKMLTGNGEFKKIMMIGFLLSALFTGIQAIANGGKFDFPQLVLGWVLYSCAFWPTATVHIESTYNGAARSVDNMPVGIAAPASIISSIGYKITELFETAYSRPTSITQNTFAAPLSILVDVRRMMTSPQIIMAMNTAISSKGGSDIERSWKNYISECTLNKVDLGQDTLQHMYSETALQAAHYDSYNLGTRLYIDPNGKPQDVTCEQAYKMLTSGNASITRLMNDTNVKGALASVTHDRNAFNTLNDALNTMGSSAQSAQQFMLNSFIDLMWGPAAIKRYQDFQGFNQAEMLHQSLMQRDTQWAAQSNLFVSAMQPLMTFFEGLSYAITPFVAFMLVFGMAGLQFAKRYVQTLIWIQLWMPIMSIINLFLVVVSSGEMSSIPVLTSMSGLSSMDSILSHWISVGGLLISATPAISLSLVYGGSVAATNLSGKLSAGDTINEKMMTPDMVTTEGVFKPHYGFEGSTFGGVTREGFQSPNLNFSENESNKISQMKSHTAQATESFGKTLSNSLSESYQSGHQASMMSSLGQTISASNSHASSLVKSISNEMMDKFGIDKSHQSQVQGAVSASLSGSAGASAFKFLQANAALKGSAGSSNSDTSSSMYAFAMHEKSDLGFSQEDKTQLLQDISYGATKQSGETFSKSLGSNQSQSLQNSAQELNSSVQSLSKEKQHASQIGTSYDIPMTKAAGIITGNSQKAIDFAQSYGALVGSGMVDDSYRRNIMPMFSEYVKDGKVADTMAKMLAMSHSSRGMESLESILWGQRGDYSMDKSIPHNDLNKEQENNKLDDSGLKNHVSSRLNESIPSKPVTENYKDWSSSLENKATSAQSEMAKKSLTKLADRINYKATNESPSLASRIMSAGDRVSGFSDEVVSKSKGATEALLSGMSASSSSFDRILDDAKSPEKREEMMSQIKNNDHAFINRYGIAGDIGMAVENTGRTIAGAAVEGFDFATNFFTGHHSDIGKATEGMNWQQKGAFMFAAAKAANDAGGDTAKKFWNTYGNQYNQSVATMAEKEYGLTKDQATIFAESSSLIPNQDNINQAMSNMRSQYDNTKYMPKNTAESIEKIVSDSASMGSQAGSWLTEVSMFNKQYNELGHTKNHS